MKATPPAKGKTTDTVSQFTGAKIRLSIDIPKDLHRKLLHYCIDHDISINQVGNDLLADFLAQHKE